MSTKSVAKSFFQSLLRHPFLLLVIQLPQGLLDILENYISTNYADTNPVVTGIYAVAAFVVGVIPQVFTFSLIWQESHLERSRRPNLLRPLQNKWGLLIATSLILSLLFAAGIMAYIVPGLILMSLYLYVPLLIVCEPKTKLSLYFYRSTRLAKKNLWKSFGFVCVVLVLFVGSQKLAEWLGENLSLLTTQESLAGVLWALPVALISMLVNVIVNTWLAHFFLALREEEQDERTLRTAEKTS